MINHDCEKKNQISKKAMSNKIDLKSSPESKQWNNLSILIMFISLIVDDGGIKYSSKVIRKTKTLIYHV